MFGIFFTTAQRDITQTETLELYDLLTPIYLSDAAFDQVDNLIDILIAVDTAKDDVVNIARQIFMNILNQRCVSQLDNS